MRGSRNVRIFRRFIKHTAKSKLADCNFRSSGKFVCIPSTAVVTDQSHYYYYLAQNLRYSNSRCEIVICKIAIVALIDK